MASGHLPAASRISAFLYCLCGVAQRFANVGGLQVRVIGAELGLLIPSATIPTIVAAGRRRFRMQVTPPIGSAHRYDPDQVASLQGKAPDCVA